MYPDVEVFKDIDFQTYYHPIKLTGSRFFGNSTFKSDWDFYAPYHETLIKELVKVGFVEGDHSCSYKDPSLHSVLTYPEERVEEFKEEGTGTIEIVCPKIDMQIIHPDWWEAKNQTQTYLSQVATYNKLPKHKRAKVWVKMLPAMKLLYI